jgi:ribosomal-protein-alanine N-acetyltransferase
MTILRTDRLTLRPSGPAHATAWTAFLQANDAHLAPWSPLPPAGFATEAFQATRMAAEAADREAGRSWRWLFFRDDELIGWANVTTIVRGVWHCANLGYAVGAEFQGQGLVREGVEAVVAHAFTELGLHRLQANYMPRNERSGRLLKRLGFKVEGYAYDYLLIDGRWEDHVLTSRTNPAWTPS